MLGDPGPDDMFDDRVYKRGALLVHALRLTLGDEAFFAALNEGQPSGWGGWGELEASWDSASYEQARMAAAGDPNRGRLGGTIVTRFMPGYVKALSGNAEGYVDLDTGLA